LDPLRYRTPLAVPAERMGFAVKVIVSVVASPRVVLPLAVSVDDKTTAPLNVTLPDAVKVVNDPAAAND
jgi:hypothetical protein